MTSTGVADLPQAQQVHLAILFVEQGQKDRAAELLSLARHHSASEQTIQERAE